MPWLAQIKLELAILAYRQFFESREIPILVFRDESVELAGAMSALIVNAKLLPKEQAVIEEVNQWLGAPTGLCALDALPFLHSENLIGFHPRKALQSAVRPTHRDVDCLHGA